MRTRSENTVYGDDGISTIHISLPCFVSILGHSKTRLQPLHFTRKEHCRPDYRLRFVWRSWRLIHERGGCDLAVCRSIRRLAAAAVPKQGPQRTFARLIGDSAGHYGVFIISLILVSHCGLSTTANPSPPPQLAPSSPHLGVLKTLDPPSPDRRLVHRRRATYRTVRQASPR